MILHLRLRPLFRLRLFFFRPSWRNFGGSLTAQHGPYVAVVARHRSTGLYSWMIFRSTHLVAESQYMYADVHLAKKIARAGLLAGEVK
jgi:hypothetical protein